MPTKTTQLRDPRRVEAAERAEEEYGSWAAFVRHCLDEYDDELRLEREVAELQEVLEAKEERLEELQEQDDEDEAEDPTDGLDDDVAQFYSDTECGSDD